MGNIVKELCEGCLKVNEDKCSVYPKPSMWAAKGGCPVKTNVVVEVKKGRVRVGQKKSKRVG